AETMLRRTQDGLLRDAAWGDHAPPLRDAQGDRIPPCPLVLYASFKLFEMLRTLRRTAYALGHTDDARYFADRAVSLRRAIIELAFNDEGFGHPVADAWALNLGVHPARGRSTLLAALREALQRHGGINPGGFFGHVQILDALFRFGTAREAIESMTCDRFPGVAWSLKHDEATSIYETFAEPGSLLYRERSANHPPYGAQAALLWSRLLGIRPRVHDCAGDTRYAHGGFARISLCPRPDAGLTRAEGWHSTPHGRVAVSLCESDDGYDWTVHLPPRTTARVHLPEGWRYASATAPKPNSLLGPGEHRFHLARERTFQEA
ncbi:MAG: alpha-L-rhamnosidase C-terminal domain-containing protein, partial [Planctomycetota bacterium]